MACVSKVEISVSNPPWKWVPGPIQGTLVHPTLRHCLALTRPWHMQVLTRQLSTVFGSTPELDQHRRLQSGAMNVRAAIAALYCTLFYATLHGGGAQLDWDAMTNQRSLQTGDVSFQGCRN